MMKYIFGLGLPRTCTNSLGSALHLLGINGECKCILNDFKNKREKDNGSLDYKYIIYNVLNICKFLISKVCPVSNHIFLYQ